MQLTRAGLWHNKKGTKTMTTRITDNGIRVLTPADGMRLTDGDTVADGEVYLGVNASPDTWREGTIARPNPS